MIGSSYAPEWYDFAVYGFFAAPIGQEFFPHQDRVAQLLSVFGVFALGYLMRPLGGAVTGHIGDRFGRRAALTFSIAGMAIPTFLIGLLPGYRTLGFLAPIGLTLLRMVQGLSVGGEYTSSMVFLVEQAPEGRRGVDRRRDGVRGHCGHPARVGRWAAALSPPGCKHIASRGAPNLGLAHPLPAGPSRWGRRLRPAPADAGEQRDAAPRTRTDRRDIP